MSDRELETYRHQLQRLVSRLGKDDAALATEALRCVGGEASGNLSNAPLHPADLGSDAFEQQVSVSLLENKRQIEGEVFEALERIERGNFGRCERCARKIGKGRLQALPYARYCVSCAHQAEKNDGSGLRVSTV